MSDNGEKQRPRKQYVPPAVERVVLDPIKEMLQSCVISGDSKLSGCGTQVTFS